MIRFISILALIITSAPGLGIGLAIGQAQGHACSDSGCHQVVIETSCCGDSSEVEFCPMSNGPCECAAAPIPEPVPKPEAPLPKPDRDTVMGMPSGPLRMIPVSEPDAATSRLASLVLGLSAGKSNNEIQALLGIWRT